MGYGRWSQGIDKHIVRWTDWFTDWIFCQAAVNDSRIVPVSFPFSRFFCDVERLENDPLESIGQGIVYTDFGECHRKIGDKESKRLHEDFYEAFIDRLRSNLQSSSFLLDCHSFPSDLSDVDICIGYNEDWSRPEDEILFQVKAVFESLGFKTGLHHPYSNSISPVMPFAYPSMMLELNKRTYMHESGELDSARTAVVVSSLKSVYGVILDRK